MNTETYCGNRNPWETLPSVQTPPLAPAASVCARVALFLVPSLFFPGGVPAQPRFADSVFGEGIEAIVYDEVILTGEVDEQVELALRISPGEPPDQIRMQILKEMIKNELIYHAVREEIPKIPPATLFSLVEREIERLEYQHGDLESVLKQEGLSLKGLRKKLKRDLERENTISLAIYRYVESKVQITNSDLERYRQEEEYKHFLDNQRIQVRQLALRLPEDATPDQVQEIERRIETLTLHLRAQPGQFVEMIREHSEHRGTRESDGLLEYRRGELGREFDAAFDARAGTFLPPFRSHFGYHIIRVERESATFRQYLEQRERQRILNEWLRELWEQAKPYLRIKGEWTDFELP